MATLASWDVESTRGFLEVLTAAVWGWLGSSGSEVEVGDGRWLRGVQFLIHFVADGDISRRRAGVPGWEVVLVGVYDEDDDDDDEDDDDDDVDGDGLREVVAVRVGVLVWRWILGREVVTARVGVLVTISL